MRHSCIKALETCQDNSAVRRACEFAGIDCSDPSALAALLVDLASARFGKENRGRPQDDWDSLSLSLLLNWYFRFRKTHPEFSDRNIFEHLAKEVGYFRDKTPETLRRRFVDAVDENKNLLLRHTLFSLEETEPRPPRRRRRSLPAWQTLPDRASEGGYMFRRVRTRKK